MEDVLDFLELFDFLDFLELFDFLDFSELFVFFESFVLSDFLELFSETFLSSSVFSPLSVKFVSDFLPFFDPLELLLDPFFLPFFLAASECLPKLRSDFFDLDDILTSDIKPNYK